MKLLNGMLRCLFREMTLLENENGKMQVVAQNLEMGRYEGKIGIESAWTLWLWKHFDDGARRSNGLWAWKLS